MKAHAYVPKHRKVILGQEITLPTEDGRTMCLMVEGIDLRSNKDRKYITGEILKIHQLGKRHG